MSRINRGSGEQLLGGGVDRAVHRLTAPFPLSSVLKAETEIGGEGEAVRGSAAGTALGRGRLGVL